MISGGCHAENWMTYTDLVGHLTDLERVSTLPDRVNSVCNGPATTEEANTMLKPVNT